MGRLWQHRNDAVPGFTSRYGVYRLVYFEMFDDMYSAIAREKKLKNWRRRWKINLIQEANPDWARSCGGARPRPDSSARAEKWALKQVQGDDDLLGCLSFSPSS